ncbi:MAG: prepilin-type N-terminal cleavage/methylation domain-containing protein [Balneolaceae bacterium]
MKTKLIKTIENEEGFSLPELLIVLVIIGILVMIAIPIYQNITTRAKTTEAKIMLGQVETLQKAYFLEYDRYSKDLAAIGFEQNKLITEDGRARYIIEIEEADEKGYTAIATSIVDFDKDEIFNVWEVNEEGIIKQRIAD